MPSQDPERVELLGDGFVRFRGERVPLEEMLYQMRRAARAADADGGLRPAIEVTDLRDLPPWDQAAQVPMQRILSDLRYYSVAVIAAEP